MRRSRNPAYTLSSVTTATSLHTLTAGVNEQGVYQVAATDRATNLTAQPLTVTRDTVPPTFTLSPAVESGALRVAWSSSDAASGVDGSTCELRVQEDDGAWQPFSTACAGDEIHSAAQPGHVYTFRLSASDNVSNPASTEALARFPRVTKYYYSGGQRVAMRADGVVYYLHGDHLGSTSLTTDASGAVVARQLYHPYGTVRHSEGTLPTDFGFTGQRHDGSTGLVFMHARYYHAGMGRWTQADTIVPEAGDPQAFNRYSYVYNRPLRYVDSDGHDPGLPPGNHPEPEDEDRAWHPDAIGWRLDASASLSAVGGDALVALTSEILPLSAALFILTHIAGDVNVDVVLNLNDQESGEWKGLPYALNNWEENLDIFFSAGGQFLTEGAAVTTGPLLITNLSRNEELVGGGFDFGGTAVAGGGVEIDFCFQPTEEGDLITTAYFAPGVGGEASLGMGAGYTWNITDPVFDKIAEMILGFE